MGSEISSRATRVSECVARDGISRSLLILQLYSGRGHEIPSRATRVSECVARDGSSRPLLYTTAKFGEGSRDIISRYTGFRVCSARWYLAPPLDSTAIFGVGSEISSRATRVSECVARDGISRSLLILQLYSGRGHEIPSRATRGLRSPSVYASPQSPLVDQEYAPRANRTGGSESLRKYRSNRLWFRVSGRNISSTSPSSVCS